MPTSFSKPIPLQQLRSELKSLQKKRNRIVPAESWQVSEVVQQQAVVLFLLSKEVRWPLLWCEHWQKTHYLKTVKLARAIHSSELQAWVTRWSPHPTVQRLLNELLDPQRILLDTFLLESHLLEYLEQQSRKGIAVPSAALADKYNRLWQHRPIPPSIHTLLLEITSNEKKRKQWARRFRRRWSVSWKRMAACHPETLEIRRDKVQEPVTSYLLSILLHSCFATFSISFQTILLLVTGLFFRFRLIFSGCIG